LIAKSISNRYCRKSLPTITVITEEEEETLPTITAFPTVIVGRVLLFLHFLLLLRPSMLTLAYAGLMLPSLACPPASPRGAVLLRVRAQGGGA
jgi:hypothetical protein